MSKMRGVSFELSDEWRLPGRDLLEKNSWDYRFIKQTSHAELHAV